MRNFDLENIKVFYIHRIYKENRDIILWFVDGHRVTYDNLTEEEEKELIKQLQEKFEKEHVILEVYNGLNEAKSHR